MTTKISYMKSCLNKLLLISLVSVTVLSCKKDEFRTILKTGTNPVLTATTTTIVLTSGNANNTATTFNWTASDFGYAAAVKYVLQVAKNGTNFATPREYDMGAGLTKGFIVSDLNQVALIAGLPPGSANQLQARVKATINANVAPIYSNTLNITVTPYLVIINYPSLYVPGDYQGWNPGAAPKISSKLGNGVYEGYVNMGGSLQFKYTSDPDWNHTNYGWASSTTTGNNVTGTLSTSGSAGNLFTPVAGYYLLKANTNTLTWDAIKTSWSLIGDFNGWGADVDMTYNATTQVWTGTINPASAGGFKFRANHDWAINLGDDGADLIMEYNGANINITPGAHTITLDLHIPGNYTYTIQ